jgi:hypothetical protein
MTVDILGREYYNIEIDFDKLWYVDVDIIQYFQNLNPFANSLNTLLYLSIRHVVSSYLPG